MNMAYFERKGCVRRNRCTFYGAHLFEGLLSSAPAKSYSENNRPATLGAVRDLPKKPEIQLM